MSKTKYPIILVHGVIVKDFKFFHAFGRIEKVLKENGYTVYTAKIDGLGSTQNNAKQLKAYIEEVLQKEGTSKVNLIAHSKGGLDSKFFIENLNSNDVVASLTTLSTPFKGSPIASMILKFPKWMVKIVAWWFDLVYKIFGDKNPDSLTVCKELEQVNELSEECLKLNSDVYCQSYTTIMKRRRDDFIMGIPLTFSKFICENETDGMVPKESTMIGEFKGIAIDDSISHSEIIDFMASKKKKEKIYAFYLMVVNDLMERGY